MGNFCLELGQGYLALIVRYLALKWRVSSIFGRKVDRKGEAKSKADATDCLFLVKFKWDWYQNSIKHVLAWNRLFIGIVEHPRSTIEPGIWLFLFWLVLILFFDLDRTKGRANHRAKKLRLGVISDLDRKFSLRKFRSMLEAGTNWTCWLSTLATYIIFTTPARIWQPIASLPLLPVYGNMSIFTTPAYIWQPIASLPLLPVYGNL